ncbi:MAG: DUF359 domain-containing protein [Candidatus Micrarchaeota archaeon]|nr:DUF359 domain-containing protein [Candidatus Micrarchaeota archaeon]
MLVLPQNLREKVRKPFGRIFTGRLLIEECRKASRPLITVGDQCSYDLITGGVEPDVIVFDFKIKRVEISGEMKKALAPHAKNAYVVLSPPGAITEELEEAVAKVLAEGKGAIFVVGEDDLSALLFMARAAGGTLVYGQPDEGAVIVPLGKKTSRKASALLAKMERKG